MNERVREPKKLCQEKKRNKKTKKIINIIYRKVNFLYKAINPIKSLKVYNKKHIIPSRKNQNWPIIFSFCFSFHSFSFHCICWWHKREMSLKLTFKCIVLVGVFFTKILGISNNINKIKSKKYLYFNNLNFIQLILPM